MTELDDLEYRVHRIIANMGSGGGEVDATTTLDTLGFDSLDVVELGIAIENEFALPSWQLDDFSGATTVQQVVNAARAARGTP